MDSLLNNSVTSPKQYHRCWFVLKKGGSFATRKSFCVYIYKVQGLNLFNLSLNQFSPPVKYRQCCQDARGPGASPCYSRGSGWRNTAERRQLKKALHADAERLSVSPHLCRERPHTDLPTSCTSPGTQLLMWLKGKHMQTLWNSQLLEDKKLAV